MSKVKGKSKTKKLPEVSPFREDLIMPDMEMVSAGSAKKKRKRKEVPAEVYSDNNEDICTVCKGTGKMICCDNCYRSFHESCCGQFSPVKGAWLCPNCYNLKQDICKNSGKKLYQKKGMKNEIIYQCSLCGSRILSSSTNVPMSLVLSSSTNINYFLNKYERFEVLSNLNLLAAGETEFKNVEDILRKIARSNSGQVHAFHICTSCLNISKTPILKNKFFVQGSDKIYLKIKYKIQSDIHEFWVNSQSIPRLSSEPIPLHPHKELREVERIIAWHRPLSLAHKTYIEMFDFLKNRKLDKIKFGTIDSLYFLVKWVGRDYNQCTWEDEYFLKASYDKVLEFGTRKCREWHLKKNQIFDFLDYSNFRKEKIVVCSSNNSSSNDIQGFDLVKEANSLRFNPKQQDEALKLINNFKASQSSLISVQSGWIKPQTLGLFSYFKYKCPGHDRSLVICPKDQINLWKNIIHLYHPRLNFIDYSIFNEAEDMISRYEFYTKDTLSIKFDVLFVSYESFEFYSKYLEPIVWRAIVVEFSENDEKMLNILKLLNSKEFKKSQYRVIVTNKEASGESSDTMDPFESETKQKVIKGIYNKLNSLRFLKKPILDFIKKLDLFDCSKSHDQILSFYLSNWEMFREKLRLKDLERLWQISSEVDLYREGEAISFDSPEISNSATRRGNRKTIEMDDGKAAMAEMNIFQVIVQLSETQRQSYRKAVIQNIDLLVKVDQNRTRKNTTAKLVRLTSKLLDICDIPILRTVEAQNNILEHNCKMRWLNEFLLASRKEKNNFVLVFQNEVQKQTYLSFFFEKRKFSVSEISESHSYTNALEIIESFNETSGSKTPLLFVNNRSLSKLKNLKTKFFIFIGLRSTIQLKDIHRVFRYLDKEAVTKVNCLVLLSEGVEEAIFNSGLKLKNMKLKQLNKVLKHRISSIKIAKAVHRAEKTPVTQHLNRVVLEGVHLLMKPEFYEVLFLSDCIQEVNDKSLFELNHFIDYKKWTLYYETLKRELQRVDLWIELKNELMESGDEEDGQASVVRKRTMKLETASTAEEEARRPLGSSDREGYEELEIENHLKKRFISTRFEINDGFPSPEVIYKLDFMQRVSILDFVMKFGLVFDSLEIFYRRFCLVYPESTKGTDEEFECFKLYMREFIYMLGLRDRRIMRKSKLLVGISIDHVYVRVIGLSAITKLVKKYMNKPELFFNEEFVELPSEYIGITNNKTYEYSKGKWNNYDDFCFLRGINRHGFGEWKSIILDEVVWEKQLKSSSIKLKENKIYKILLKKLNEAHYEELKRQPRIKHVLIELLKRKGYNLLNLIYEYMHKITI